MPSDRLRIWLCLHFAYLTHIILFLFFALSHVFYQHPIDTIHFLSLALIYSILIVSLDFPYFDNIACWYEFPLLLVIAIFSVAYAYLQYLYFYPASLPTLWFIAHPSLFIPIPMYEIIVLDIVPFYFLHSHAAIHLFNSNFYPASFPSPLFIALSGPDADLD